MPKFNVTKYIPENKIFNNLDNISFNPRVNINTATTTTISNFNPFSIAKRRILRRKPKMNGNNAIYKFNNIKSYHSLKKTNAIAKSLGFKNSIDVDDFIKKVNPHKLTASETKKMSNLYRYLLKVSKKHPKTIAKLAVAGGTLTAMIIYLKRFQNTYNGCFRYNNNDDELIKYKFDGIWCNNNNNNKIIGKLNDDNIKLIPENEHPLYDKIKWDCNYNNFNNNNNNNKKTQEKINQILNLGCNGLCSVDNFNILANTTNGEYNPIVINKNNILSSFTYKCETITMLQALSTTTVNALDEIVTGLFDGNIINEIIKLFFVVILIFIIFKGSLHFRKKVRQNTNV